MILANRHHTGRFLTKVLAAFFIGIGVSRISYAWKCWSRGWRWKMMLVGGGINLLRAGMIVDGWPRTALWIIGLFVAIETMINGWRLIAVAKHKFTYEEIIFQPSIHLKIVSF